MNKILADILDRPVPKGLTIQKTNELIKAVEKIDLNSRLVYSAKGEKILNELDKFGVKEVPQNYRGVLLEHWLELLTQTQETITETSEYTESKTEVPKPKGENATTLTSDQFENLEGDLERVKKSEEIRAKQKVEIESALKRKQKIKDEQDRAQKTKPLAQTISLDEIETEQQNLKEEIKKAESVQEELKGKKVYAKVVIPEIPVLTPEEQDDFEELEAFAKDPKTRTKLIDDLEKEIETRIKPTLKEASEEDIKIIARSTAVDLVEKLANPEARQETRDENIQTAVYQSFATNPKVIKNIVSKPEQLQELEKGSIVLALHKKESNSTSQTIAGVLIGPKFTRILYGPDYREIKVIISEAPTKDQTHTIDLGSVNREFINLQQKQNVLLEHAKTYGIQETRGYISNQAGIYISKVVEKMPAGSVVKKAYSSPILQSFLSKYGLAKPVVWEAVGQSRVAELLIKVAPESAGPTLAITGKVLGKELVKPVVVVATKEVGKEIAIQATKEVGKKAAGGLLAKIIGTVAGPFSAIPVVGPILNWLFAEVVVRGLGELWSKAKIWFKKNQDKIAPILAVGGALTIGRFFGPAAGILGGVGTFALFGGSVAGLAYGTWRFFGILGRSIGITIATPVIVTLLVLPPLVAFIMLVINNSAYVVPPGLLGGKTENLYLSVTKTAEPSGPFENTALPLKIKYTIVVNAKKGALTDINFNHTCKVIKSGSIQDCQAPTEQPPSSIATSYTYTYEVTYNTTYNDSMVINKFCVSAKNTEGEEQESCGSATITIGKPPAECFVVDDSFGSKKSLVETAVFEKLVGEYSPYSAKVCASLEGRTIEFRYGHQYLDYWGWNHSNEYIEIFDLGLRNQDDTNYIVFHEVAHVMTFNNDQWYDEYKQFPNTLSEKPFCFYTYETITGEWPYEERFAESAAFYAFNPCGNFQQRYPASYKYMDEILFK